MKPKSTIDQEREADTLPRIYTELCYILYCERIYYVYACILCVAATASLKSGTGSYYVCDSTTNIFIYALCTHAIMLHHWKDMEWIKNQQVMFYTHSPLSISLPTHILYYILLIFKWHLQLILIILCKYLHHILDDWPRMRTTLIKYQDYVTVVQDVFCGHFFSYWYFTQLLVLLPWR